MKLKALSLLLAVLSLGAVVCGQAFQYQPPTAGTSFGRAIADLGNIAVAGPPVYAVAISDAHQAFVKVFDAVTGVELRHIPIPQGSVAGGQLGAAVAAVPDLDGDNVRDLLVGDPGYDGIAGTDVGAVYVYSGAAGILPLQTLFGDATGDQFGTSVAGIGDLPSTPGSEGDFIVGASGHNGGGSGAGMARVYRGNDCANACVPVATFFGSTSGYRFGSSVAGGGDLNGDQVPDFAVGAPGAASLGSNTGSITVYSGQSLAPIGTIAGTVAGSKYGHSLSFVGDCNCDTFGDLAVGAPGHPGTNGGAGRVMVLRGGASISGSNPLFTRDGDRPGVALGWTVARGGDVTGDGLPDIIVGEGEHVAGAANSIRPYVISGESGAVLANFSTITTSQGGSPAVLEFPCHEYLSAADKATEVPIPSTPIGTYSNGGALPGSCGGAGSSGAGAVVLPGAAPAITINTQPVSLLTVCPGSTAVFFVQASSSIPLGYQWFRNDVAVAGATGPVHIIQSANSGQHSGTYRCRIVTVNANPLAPCTFVNSDTVSLSFLSSGSPIVIIQHPTDQTVCTSPPPAVQFSVIAGGSGLTHQWNRDGSAVSNGNGVSGATTGTVTLGGVTLAHAGTYTCSITNATCSITSAPAVLTVHGGLTLFLDQPAGPGSLRIRHLCGQPGPGFNGPQFMCFTSFSPDPRNASNPGTGWWGGLYLSIDDLLAQWQIFYIPNQIPPWYTVLDAQGRSTFSLPAGAISVLAGQHIAAVTWQLSVNPFTTTPTLPYPSNPTSNVAQMDIH